MHLVNAQQWLLSLMFKHVVSVTVMLTSSTKLEVHRNTAREGLSHGHVQDAQKMRKVWPHGI